MSPPTSARRGEGNGRERFASGPGPATEAQGATASQLGSPASARLDHSVITSQWGRRDKISRRMLLLADVTGILIALYAAALIVDFRADPFQLVLYALPTLPAWAVLFKLYGLYDRDVKRISHTGIDDVPHLFHALVVGILLFWAYVKWVPGSRLLFAEAASFGTVGLVVLVALRSMARRIVVGRTGAERVLIAGAGPTSALLVRKIVQHPEYGLTPVGRIAPIGAAPEEIIEPAVGPATTTSVPLLGTAEDLERLVADGALERVILCRADLETPEVLRMADVCHRYAIKVGIVPGATEAYGPSVELDEVEGVTVIGVNRPVLGRTSRWLKRGFDLIGSAAALLLAAPLMLVVALAIPLDSRGPVLYRQARIGRGGRHVMVNKFRTMAPGADRHREALMAESADPNWLHLDEDPRVTRLGALLRKTSIDELPQLWNVLTGEMSLVGPRPLPEKEDARIDGWARGRLDLTPGITGLWQVLGRTSIPFDEMVKLDYIYVTNWSVWMDIRLLLRTLPAVIRQRGAN